MSDDYLDGFDPDLRKAYELAHEKVDPSLVDHEKVKIKKESILLSGDGTFFTLQGEGPTLGMPCVFCRLHVCNLRCTWCDAFYTWNPHAKEFWTESFRLGFNECAERIEKTWASPVGMRKRVIFSGGEPLIQKTQIDNVMVCLNLGGSQPKYEPWEFEIETNGTLMPTTFQLAYAQFNCSPKLDNSENKHYSMVKPKVLKELNKANTTFKFVCRDENDLKEIEEKYVPHISEQKIIIMPEGITEEEITPNARALYEPVLKRGWRMTPRFQAIFADGARRGV